MDGLSGAASVIAVIDISAKIASLYYQYSVAVKDSKNDIKRVRRKVSDITHILEKIKQLLDSHDKTRLSTIYGLFSSLEQCREKLKSLEAKLDPGKTRKTMSRFGFRALKWLFMNLAKLPVAIGASFNSYNEEYSARCLPNTRTELLDEITTWANNKDGNRGQLRASFFFKKGESERGNTSRFFTTIATDLAACEPGILPSIRKTLDEDSTISHKALKDQFEKLILQPLLGIKQARSRVLARVVVINALDEYKREADTRAILQLLARTKDIRPVPLRIIVTSRPELHIRLGFKEMPNGTYQDLVLHEVPRHTIEHDIPKQQILTLVELSVPLFIYAATVCRYISSKGSSPTAFLEKVLQYQKATFSQLDRTYLPVLDHLLSKQKEDKKKTWLQTFREVVGSVIVLKTPLSAISLARLLQVPQEEIQCRLDSLHSVLSVSNSEDAPVRLLHLSFREFLVDPQKQGKSPF
ncbi:hypothetical protein COCSADRAFT_158031 [Bipolaris sorokiniana ND90Pr]|uniref:Nephrocystin 3-like N-terminal domain-containing protein n=1 Tax=Cochliobolus sativus (strain ND90Pr / ATCC 201652) TaxID=665912 RepID=M2RM21_COCSN|nr:uncharacterized protein COCSADRAFT_158031 [Bipolaris sorokiniana ND90Pr]EMD67664.1 hypothetical protein COCSADRAFT_158031 [Bipolaris sorokiniana ND90Pr]